jgi:hypothetical protein
VLSGEVALAVLAAPWGAQPRVMELVMHQHWQQVMVPWKELTG